MGRITLLLLAFGLFFNGMYSVERPDGGVTIIRCVEADGPCLERAVRDNGWNVEDIKKITRDDLPDREDREYWQVNDVPIGKKLKVNSVKKAKDEADQAQFEAEQDEIFLKMKIDKGEWKKINKKKFNSVSIAP